MGGEVRRERDRDVGLGDAAQAALDLRDVAVSDRRVGLDAAVDLAQVGALGRGAAGAGDAGLAVDGDRGVGQAGLDQRREREQRGRGVAAGVGHEGGAGDLVPEQLGEAVGPVGVEPEVGPEVDDGRAGGAQLRAHLGALAVRQGQERDVAQARAGRRRAAS